MSIFRFFLAKDLNYCLLIFPFAPISLSARNQEPDGKVKRGGRDRLFQSNASLTNSILSVPGTPSLRVAGIGGISP
jgi:hypothetical protein